MRYLFLTLLTGILLISTGCKKSGPSGDQSAQKSGTAQQSTEKSSTPQKDGIIGSWEDYSNPVFSSTITILSEDGQLYLESKYGDGSVRRMKLVEKDSPLGRRFDPVPAFQLGDHWVIDSNGDLLIRDNSGTIFTAKKIEQP